MKTKYIAPEFKKAGFTCPSCLVTAVHHFHPVPIVRGEGAFLFYSSCTHCGEKMLWVDEEIIYPKTSTAPIVEEDFPSEIQAIIEEARLVYEASPRAALALLRVALEHICANQGFAKGYLKKRLENLIKDKQLSIEAVEGLTIIKALGDDSVHAIPIIEGDTKELATFAFNLVANIGDTLYTQPNRRKSLLDQLKDGKRLKTANDIKHDKEEEE